MLASVVPTGDDSAVVGGACELPSLHIRSWRRVLAPERIRAQMTGPVFNNERKSVHVEGRVVGHRTQPPVARHVHVLCARGGVAVGRRRVGVRRRVVGIHIGAGVGAVRAGVGDVAVAVVIVSVAASGAAERGDHEPHVHPHVHGVEKEQLAVTVCLTVGHQSFLCSAHLWAIVDSSETVVYTILAVLSISPFG